MTTPVRRARRGFTLVELMMALAVLAVGMTGIFAMHKVTAMTNLHSKSVAIATRIAQTWQTQLMVNGTLWRTTNSSGLTTIGWLQNAADASPSWFRPAWVKTRGIGAAFDALGNPVDTDTDDISRAQFCVHLLLVPVVPLTDPANAVIRATVRVLWPRTEGDPGSTHFCAADVTTVGNDTQNFHSLYQTTAIRVHP